MGNNEIQEKYGISGRMLAGIIIQAILLVAALALTVVGIVTKRADLHRVIIYSIQAIVCLGLISLGLIHFKEKNRNYFRIILYLYAFLELFRAATLNTSGIGLFVSGISRFILAAIGALCILIEERIDRRESISLAFCNLALEVVLYLIFIFGYPGMMYGRINRYMPLVSVLIAGSFILFLKAKMRQLGENKQERELPARYTGTIASILALAVSLSALAAVSTSSPSAPAAIPSGPLASWTEDAKSREALLSYLEDISDKDSEDYIPVSSRVAVFDLDGTLFCETDPVYFDYCLLKYRVTEDPDYKDRASDFEKEVAAKIRDYIDTGKAAEGLEVDHGRAVASAFSGLTVDEFHEYVKAFRSRPALGYDGMTIGEGFYKPMLEVVSLLQKYDFAVYVVSGTDRLIVRGLCDGTLDIPESNLIGSDETIRASGQGDTDGLEYVFDESDKLILGGDFLIKNLKMNKVSVIMQEIGVQPVLSFGNSTGDSSMAEFVTSSNPYKSLAFMLCCDDTVRENGNESKADKMYDLCKEFDWIPVSMKNDWKTIYGDGVKRK